MCLRACLRKKVWARERSSEWGAGREGRRESPGGGREGKKEGGGGEEGAEPERAEGEAAGEGEGRGSRRGQSDLKGWGRPQDVAGVARSGQEPRGTACGRCSGSELRRLLSVLSGRGLPCGSGQPGTRGSAARCRTAPPWPGAPSGTGPRLGVLARFPPTPVRSSLGSPGRGSGRGSRDAARSAHRHEAAQPGRCWHGLSTPGTNPSDWLGHSRPTPPQMTRLALPSRRRCQSAHRVVRTSGTSPPACPCRALAGSGGPEPGGTRNPRSSGHALSPKLSEQL